jgi:hypothetical protein
MHEAKNKRNSSLSFRKKKSINNYLLQQIYLFSFSFTVRHNSIHYKKYYFLTKKVVVKNNISCSDGSLFF